MNFGANPCKDAQIMFRKLFCRLTAAVTSIFGVGVGEAAAATAAIVRTPIKDDQ